MCLELIFGLKKVVVYFLFPAVTWTKKQPIFYCKIIENFKIK